MTPLSITSPARMTALLERPELSTSLHIKNISIEPIAAELITPFPIASDTTTYAERVNNVLVRMHMNGGAVGLGEAAPFEGISGDTQKLLLDDLEPVARSIIGSVLNVFELENIARDACGFPAARAALDMAFLDALARKNDLRLSTFLRPDAKAVSFETDVTIPLVGLEETKRLAVHYAAQGFGRIKIKVGHNVQEDLDRLWEIHQIYQNEHGLPELKILADANEGYSLDDAIAFVRKSDPTPVIFEQPVARHAIADLKAVGNLASIFGIEVYADESVYTAKDAAHLIERGAVHGFNLKLMKHGGFSEALRIADLAIEHGLGLMIGGMIETRLAMTASLHLARIIGHEHLRWLDLDTPMFMNDEHLFTGGIQYAGPRIQFPDHPAAGVSVEQAG